MSFDFGTAPWYTWFMRFAFALTLFLALPAMAEEGSEPEGNLFDEGMRNLLDRFLADIDPALEALREGLSDLNSYHAPEILPNGDIIIRRKTPVERLDPEDSIEL